MIRFWSVVVRCSACSAFCTNIRSRLILCSEGTGYGSQRFGRRARFGMALVLVVPTYSRGSGSIVVRQYLQCKKE